jgi:hypothetical protein
LREEISVDIVGEKYRNFRAISDLLLSWKLKPIAMKIVKMCLGLALALLITSCNKEAGMEIMKEGGINPQFASTNYDWSAATDWSYYTDNGDRRWRINVSGTSDASATTSCTVNHVIDIELQQGTTLPIAGYVWVNDPAYTVPQMWVYGDWSISYGLDDAVTANCVDYDRSDHDTAPIMTAYNYTDNPTNTGSITLTSPDIAPNGVVNAPSGKVFCDAIHAYQHQWNVAFEDQNGNDHACSLSYNNGTTHKACN